MAQRIFIACRSNHDPITIGRLACQAQLGREYDSKVDFIRWAGAFDIAQNPRKCQVLIDCDAAQYALATEVKLSCYQANSDGDELSISKIGTPLGLHHRLKKDYAWGKRGSAS